MNIYFLTLEVSPSKANQHYNVVEGALAHCWVLEDSPENALSKATFHVSKYDWELERIESPPVETTKDHFIGKDLGLQGYEQAQEDGIAITVLAWSRDGKTSFGPTTLKPSASINIDHFLKAYRKHQRRGRFLHYASDGRCKEIINAHSIQRSRSLSQIAHNGHVYRLTADIGSLEKDKGRLSCQERSVDKISTFLGFCKRHDNDLFEPIDNFPLKPTDEQIFLYGYRSLCRELFVKENAVNSIGMHLNVVKQKSINAFLTAVEKGMKFGFDNLKCHKSIYDDSLRNGHYNNIEYVLFISNQTPIVVFSGIFYPDFDFMGRQLQDLASHSNNLELITFCSAPMRSGWGFLFSWHTSSSSVCTNFMRSLATVVYENRKLEDMLFRLVISNCENHAISPQWWDSLPALHKEQIIDRASRMADVLVKTHQSYLMEGLEGIAGWKFQSVISNMK